LLAAEKIGLPPEKCVVFEDSFNGIRAAYAAGTFPIMIPDRAEPTPEILKLCTKFSSLLEALNHLKSIDF
jgi:beta-phosphoglucomutase-like phosphatase (HAD superfamily)